MAAKPVVYAQIHPTSVMPRPSPIGFAEHPVGMTQTRLLGRTMLVPTVDLRNYRFRAVIDVVVVTVELARETQFQWVRRTIDPVLAHTTFHVEAISPHAGGATSTFSIRVQAPESAERIAEAVNALRRKFGVVRDRIDELEISVDIYPNDPTDVARHEMLQLVQRTYLAPEQTFEEYRRRPRAQGATHRRLVSDEGNKKNSPIFALLLAHHNAPDLGSTLYVGDDHEDWLVRIMDKVTDQRNKATETYRNLPDAERRVRIEVRLRNHMLRKYRLRSSADFVRFPYRQLQGDFFRFRLPTFLHFPGAADRGSASAKALFEGLPKQMFARTGCMGLQARNHARGVEAGRRLGTKLWVKGEEVPAGKLKPVLTEFLAYEKFNERISTALRHLADREKLHLRRTR